jgi:hypothetical protein
VTWTLTGQAPHSVTADDGAFDSGVLDPDATFAHTFADVGTFTYACLVHPSMKGTVVVVDAPATAGVAAASDTGGAGGGGLMGPMLWGIGAGLAMLALAGGLFVLLSRYERRSQPA